MSEDNAFRVHGRALARRKPAQRPKSGEVATVTVHPQVWRAALDAADGDATRLVVESPTSVTVLNRGRGSRS